MFGREMVESKRGDSPDQGGLKKTKVVGNSVGNDFMRKKSRA
jgi:hypothetical protein